MSTFLKLVAAHSALKYKEVACNRTDPVKGHMAESGIVVVDGTFFGNSFEQDRSWDDSGTTISGI